MIFCKNLDKNIKMAKRKDKFLSNRELLAMNELRRAFYETPDDFFDSLANHAIQSDMPEEKFVLAIRKAIFTVKRSRLTIADILSEWYEKAIDNVY